MKEARGLIVGHLARPDLGGFERSRLEAALKELTPDLEGEWQRQAENFIRLGFHKALRMREGRYVDSLPHFSPQPENFKGRFDIPLLVETRLPVPQQARLAKVTYYLEGLNVRDWEEDPLGYQTLDHPYTTWVQDGKKNLKVSVENVRAELESDERGGTEYDGIAFYIHHPEILEDHFIDLPGTSVGAGGAPCLGVFGGEPELNGNFVDDASPRFGSLSCGRS